jgi:hypothetical protein
VLEERATLNRDMAERALQGQLDALAQTYQQQSRDAGMRAEVIRSVIARNSGELSRKSDAKAPPSGKQRNKQP